MSLSGNSRTPFIETSTRAVVFTTPKASFYDSVLKFPLRLIVSDATLLSQLCIYNLFIALSPVAVTAEHLAVFFYCFTSFRPRDNVVRIFGCKGTAFFAHTQEKSKKSLGGSDFCFWSLVIGRKNIQNTPQKAKNKTPRRTFYFEDCESKAISLGTSRRGTRG